MYEENVRVFGEVLSRHWDEYKKKLKQYCFLNGITWSEDTFNETYVNCVDLISRKGLRDMEEQTQLDYFFRAFKFNTYQEHYQRNKTAKDDNIDVYELDIVDESDVEEQEEQAYNNAIITNYILMRVREEFDEIGYHIFRLRHMFSLNNKQLKFKEIKRITNVENTRARLLKMNEFVQTVVGDEIKNKDKRFVTFKKQYE